jgi:RHS repeat-associated protein
MKKGGLIILILILFFINIIQFSLAEIEYNFSYDENGNLIQGFGKYYEYNEFNQLERVHDINSTGRIISKYFYDQNGDRILKQEFFLDGSNQSTYYINENFVQVRNSSGIFNFTYYYDEYNLVAEKKLNGNINYYHPDYLGSTTLITNESGDIVEETFYLPYGEIIEGGAESRYLFTGKEKDTETGLSYYGARYYNSYIMQFIQPDSIIPDVYDPQQLNRYSYARDNPYKYTDPSGNYIESALDIGFISWDISEISQDPTNWINYASLGLDVMGLSLPFATGLGEGFKIGVKGLNKVDNIGDTVLISDKAQSSIKAVDKTKDLIQPFSKSNFRKNLLIQSGESGINKEAHHNLPQQFKDKFSNLGINVHDPKFGSLVEKMEHRQTASAFNRAFKQFFKESQVISYNQVLDRARDISSKFGFSPQF